MSRSLLLIARQAPWSGCGAREALDIVLAGGAFDLPLSLLFLDDGVLQLAPRQHPGRVQHKDLAANLKALPLFGVDALYACRHSLQQRGLLEGPLAIAAQPLDAERIHALIDRHDLVITL